MSNRTDNQFMTTRWTVVLAAGGGAGRTREEALTALCQEYWKPVYAYIRWRGEDPEKARDLTQEFFARLLEKDWLAGLEREGAKFRAFLLTAVKRFLAVEHHRETAAKRGGGMTALSLDWATAPEPASREETPEQAFDHRWTLTVIDRAMGRLRVEAETAGKVALFGEVAEFLSGEPQPGAYESAAAALGMTRAAVMMAVHRLRLRFRELVRLEVAETLADPSNVDDEMRELLAVLRGG
jgi:DNA-directed RNA polymerase specialized sigma24 family protein